jgi:hypothetical protein
MTICNRFAISLSVALAASACLSAPSLAQKGDTADRRGCFPVNGINCASQGCDLGWSRPMVAQPAEELPSTRALQQAVDPKREPPASE